MEVRRIDPQTIAISGLNLLLCELLQQVVVSAEAEGDLAAQARLFSSPSGGTEPELDADWDSYVRPGLAEQFESTREIVRQDLQDFPPNSPAQEHTLRLPLEHLDPWINVLNQARLALAVHHKVTEREMEHVPRDGDTRALAIFQIHFYGLLQEWFIRELQA